VDSLTVPVEAADPARTPPIFWGHGQQDGNIPYSLGERGRGRLRKAGIAVDSFDHPGGHTITVEEMHALQRWLREVAGEIG
jgi:predicted esterase